jgi:iron complex outermembrane receptor protein
MNKRTWLHVLACVPATWLLSTHFDVVRAQAAGGDQQATNDQKGSDSTAKEKQLQEIVIHGRKVLIDTHNVNLGAFGSKDVMDVPIDMVSYSSALIDNQFARTLDDVMRNDPGVSDAPIGGAYDNIRIRGFAVDWTNTMRRDGLSLAPYQDIPLEAIARVDVLKGPSGFLYGFNSPGGTINFITKQPTLDPFAEVTAQWRSFDGYYAHVDTSDTIDDGGFGYRTNLAYEKVGDFTHSGDLERKAASESISWRLSDRAVLQLNGDWQNKALAAQPVIGLTANGSLPPMINPRTLLGEPWFKYTTNTADVAGKLDYSLTDNWYVVAQVAYTWNTRDAAFPDIYETDSSGDILSGDLVLSPGQSYKTTSGQFFVSGNFDTGPVAHDLVAGVSARYYDAHELGYATLTTMTVGNMFNPVYFPEIPLANAPPKNHTVNRQVGPFVSDLLTFSKSWQALFGARYIEYSNTLTEPGGVPTPYVKNSVAPSVGLIYKPTQQVMTYLNYSQGLEQSEGAPYYAKNAGVALNPLVSTQYEAGVKTRVASDFTVGLAAFQIKKPLEYVDSDNYFVQNGLQRHRGLELTGTGQIAGDTTLIAGVQWLDAVQVQAGDPTVNGKRTEDVPKWQANLFIDTPISAVNGLSVNGGVNFVGNRAVGPQNVAFIPAYTRLDLGMRYLTQLFGKNFIFRGEIKNVTDKRYWAGAEYTSVYPGEPRTIYISMSVDLM